MGEFVQLKAADGQQIPAYVARPAGKARGGVVVVQEIFGVNSHIRAVADGYAAEGYLAVAPAPLREANLIGNGPQALRDIDMIGNDFAMGGPGTCGKDGQGVPVGTGQPTLRVTALTIGGTAA